MKMYTYDEVSQAALQYFNNDNLAATTWINKYARRDKDGNLLDLTPDDMHKRMAKAFAEIEEKYRHKLNPDDNLKLSEYGYSREELTEEKIYNLFKNFKYVIPAGSVMSGIGNYAPVSLSNCFIAGTKVLTKTGLKNIENIQIGEYVLSDDGEYHKVVNTLSRDYSGDLYKFESTEIYEPIICTPNHKFLTNHGWKRADRILAPGSKQIRSVDKLKIAYTENNIFAHNGEGSIIDLTEGYIPSENQILLENGNKISLDQHFIGGNNAHSHKQTFELNKTFEFDSDFAYFVGRWLGDGSITRRKGKRNHEILQIVFNATTEKDAFERCKEIGERKFGLKANVCITKQNVIALRFNSELIGSWFYREFGEKCDGKHIPDKYNGNLNMLLGLCDSDGCVYGHGGFKLFLKNDNLISWARLTMYLNNINASAIHQRKNEGYYSVGFEVTVNQATSKLNKYLTKQYADNRREEYIRDITNDYAQIQSVEILENQNVKVYNLSVEDTHTYNVNGVFCHNCWVISGPEDSLDDIFRVCNEQSQLMKRRGGVGFDISNLRPSGATVNNSAKSSTGAASFMDLFSHVTNTIAQNGRRGALMLSIHIQHPDSQLFIEKKQDLSKVTGANVSVQIDDEFMECVKADKDYFQVWPINAAVNDELTHRENKLNSYNEYEYNKMYPMVYTDKSKFSSVVKQGYIKKIKAKELWDKLIHCAWNTAEPGIIFQTKHHNYSPDGVYPSFRGTCTNPCVTGDTKLHTNIGELEIKDVIDRINNGEEIKVLSYDNINDTVEYQQVNSGCLTRENANIIEIETEDGNKLRLTPDHKVYTENRGYIQASELTKDDILLSI